MLFAGGAKARLVIQSSGQRKHIDYARGATGDGTGDGAHTAHWMLQSAIAKWKLVWHKPRLNRTARLPGLPWRFTWLIMRHPACQAVKTDEAAI
jgi:hypothetical protein